MEPEEIMPVEGTPASDDSVVTDDVSEEETETPAEMPVEGDEMAA
jgi:hypothetical protein